MNKILVTGCNGQLGYDCIKALKEKGYNNIIAVDRQQLDITNESAVIKYITSSSPKVIIHCAAYTNVDKAEVEPKLAYDVNVMGTKYLAMAAKKIDAKMVFISTDYVFDGKGNKYHNINDIKNGLSIYGQTKSIAEFQLRNILDKYYIIRTSWVFGSNGNNFVKTMLKISKEKNTIAVVDDQIGSPTYTVDLSKLICDIIETDKYGIYHATNEGLCSWYEFACEIFNQANTKINVIPITTAEYSKKVPNQAKRPLNSRLSKESLDNAGFKRLPIWQDALKRYLKEIM